MLVHEIVTFANTFVLALFGYLSVRRKHPVKVGRKRARSTRRRSP